MTTLTTTARAGQPSLISRPLDTTLRRLTSALEADPSSFRSRQIAASAAPSPGEREALAERRAALDVSLQAADEADVKRLVAALLSGFSGAQTAPDAVRLSVALYVSALKRFPLWAVAEACRRFTDGTSETGAISAFAPSPPQFAEEVRRVVEPWLAERGRIIAVLDATVYGEATPEERARVDRVIADLKESLAASAPAATGAEKREAALNRFVEASDRLIAREYLAAGGKPDARVSPGLARKLAEMKAEIGERSYPEAAE